MYKKNSNKILIIDDDFSAADKIEFFLEDQGFIISSANDVNKGLSLFQNEKFDLVIISLQLPEINCIDVIKIINNVSNNIPVIVISSYSDKKDIIEIFQSGAWDYIDKSIEDASLLISSIKKCLEKSNILIKNRDYQKYLESLIYDRTKELHFLNENIFLINQRLKNITQTAKDMTICSHADKLGVMLLEEFGRHMQSKGGSLYLVKQNCLEKVHSLDPGHSPEIINLPLNEKSIFNNVYKNKMPLLVNDLNKYNKADWKGYENESVLCYPICDEKNDVLGILSLHNKLNPPFTEQDKEIGTILTSYFCEAFKLAQSTEELKMNEELFRLLTENQKDVVLKIASDKKIIYCSPAIKEIGGYEMDEVKNLPFYEFGSEQSDYYLINKTFNEIVKEKQARIISFMFKSKSNGIFPVEVMINPLIEKNKIISYQCIMRDITERIKTQSVIAQERDLFKRLMETSPVGIIIFDKDGRIIKINKKFKKLFRLEDESIIKKSNFNLFNNLKNIDGSNIDQNDMSFNIIKNTKKPLLDYQVLFENNSGENLIFLMNAAPLFDEKKNFDGMFVIIQDISEKLQLEEQLRQSQKMESIGKLAGGIAHDFNNLLQPIIGYSELLLLDLTENDLYHKEINEINKAADKAKNLIEQLLVFSRNENCEMVAIDLNEVIINFKKILRGAIRENIEIKLELDQNISKICANVSQIEQVLMNLTVNAQDAMPNGGEIIFKTGMKIINKPINLEEDIINPGKFITLIVSDSGIGIKKEIISHVFEPFFTTKPKGEGTGLGLSIVYRIIKEHYGLIDVNSIHGKGAAFNIYLPEANTKNCKIEENIIENKILHGKETIFVVEDDDMVRNLTSAMLKRNGYNIVETNSPDNCIKMVREYKGEINLLLTDVIMPGMNGVELYNALNVFIPNLKVLFFSGYNQSELSNHGFINIDKTLIKKPFDINTISKKIREVLDD